MAKTPAKPKDRLKPVSLAPSTPEQAIAAALATPKPKGKSRKEGLGGKKAVRPKPK